MIARPGYKTGQYLDDLVCQEPSRYNTAIEHLKDIWQALGKERTRLELVPLLEDIVYSGHTEQFLVCLASQIKPLGSYIGGNYFSILSTLINRQLCSEDSSVRDQVDLT